MTTITGKPITRNGFGLMKLTFPHEVTSDDTAFEILRAALECGANVWNGADFYGTEEHNSLHLMNRYFTKYPEDADKVVLCVKSGVSNIAIHQVDGSPEFLRLQADKANKILDGKKKLDIFGPARIDPNVPVETTIEGLAQLIKEGKTGGIQLTEVGSDTLCRASKVHKIDMVEEEASLWTADIFTNGIAKTCAELNIVIMAHSPLGAGMLTGRIKSIDDIPANDRRRLLYPRYQPENFQKNMDLITELNKFAELKGCSIVELALSWLKSGSGEPGKATVLPIAGARSEERVRANCKEVDLSKEDLKQIAAIIENFPVAGDRWFAAAMKYSEY